MKNINCVNARRYRIRVSTVYCYNTQKTYNSIVLALIWVNILIKTITISLRFKMHRMLKKKIDYCCTQCNIVLILFIVRHRLMTLIFFFFTTIFLFNANLSTHFVSFFIMCYIKYVYIIFIIYIVLHLLTYWKKNVIFILHVIVLHVFEWIFLVNLSLITYCYIDIVQ